MPDINRYGFRTGRMIREDNTTVNEADLLAQLVVNTGGASGSAVKGAVLNVTTAGTRVQLPDYPCREVTIIAKEENTGSIFAGGSDVSSTVYGVKLKARDSYTFAVSNANMVYINSSVSGEGVSYVAL